MKPMRMLRGPVPLIVLPVVAFSIWGSSLERKRQASRYSIAIDLVRSYLGYGNFSPRTLQDLETAMRVFDYKNEDLL